MKIRIWYKKFEIWSQEAVWRNGEMILKKAGKPNGCIYNQATALYNWDSVLCRVCCVRNCRACLRIIALIALMDISTNFPSFILESHAWIVTGLPQKALHAAAATKVQGYEVCLRVGHWCEWAYNLLQYQSASVLQTKVDNSDINIKTKILDIKIALNAW